MATDLVARLDRLEAELRALEMELAQLRTFAAVEQLRGTEKPTAVVSPVTGPPRAAPSRLAPPAPSAPPASPSVRPGPPPPTSPPPAPPTPPPAPIAQPIAQPVASAAAAGSSEREPSKEWMPTTHAEPSRPLRRTLRELAVEWELTGARGFAIVGGAVLALGIGFFFVLAANRGWIDARARVALGAAASSLALAVGLVLRSRYGQYWAALGAVGAGIAGAYATLAAATARYDLVPDALGLPIAGVIAAVGTAIAVRWHSEVIAGLGLLGAALAPALQAIDTGMGWEAVAFALIVLVATAVIAVPRGWLTLLHVTAAVVAVQGLWLVAETEPPAGTGAIAVTAALAAVVLGIAIELQVVRRRDDLDPIALTYTLFALGVPLFSTSSLFQDRTDRGLALVGISALWVAALVLLGALRKLDLAFVVGASALALTALGTALVLTDSALTVTWSVEAILLAALAARFADARLESSAILYATLATGAALVTDGDPRTLFDPDVDHLAAVVPLALCAAALAAPAFALRSSYLVHTEQGLLAFVGDLRRTLESFQRGLREILLYAAAATATLAGAFLCVSISYDRGHVAATALVAVVGAVILGLAGVLRRDALSVAAYIWIGVALVAAIGFDIPEFYEDATETSLGGWSLIVVAAALLGGSYVQRVHTPGDRGRDLVAGAAFAIAAAVGALGIGLVVETRVPGGLGLLLEAAVFSALAGAIFRKTDCRNVTTTLWSLAVVVLVVAESVLITDSIWRGIVIAATGVGVAALADPLREERLWLAGGALAAATSIVVLLAAQPWLQGSELSKRFALATTACAVATVAIAALRWTEPLWRDLVTTLWSVGILAVLVTERLLIADDVWLAVTVAATAVVVAALAEPLGEERLWLAGGALAVVTAAIVLTEQARPWLADAELSSRVAIATSACALAAFGVAALRWGSEYWRDLVTVLWATGILALLASERLVLADVRASAIAFALTGGVLALVAHPLREPRVWLAGGSLVGATLVTTLVDWTPPVHLLAASSSPAGGLPVLVACLVGLGAVAVTSRDPQTRIVLEAVTGGTALYALSLGILEIAERVSTASVETDFERGHTAVSGLWALVGLALLVAGLLRGSSTLRYAGFALFGLSLAKIFLYDLSSLSSVARAFSFILVGGLLLAGGFFLQRLSDRLGPPRHP